MRVIAASLTVALLVGAPAAVAQEKEKSRQDPDKVICRSERTVGSNRSQRICLTRAQWDQIRTSSKDVLDDRRDRGSPMPKGAGG